MSNRSGKEISCRACNKIFYAAQWDIDRGRKYCTHACSEIGSGAYKTTEGYIKVLIRNHPRADASGFVYEHVAVMEKHLGRMVSKKEVVHHLDHNKTNNDITNLALLPSNSDHVKLHRFWATSPMHKGEV